MTNFEADEKKPPISEKMPGLALDPSVRPSCFGIDVVCDGRNGWFSAIVVACSGNAGASGAGVLTPAVCSPPDDCKGLTSPGRAVCPGCASPEFVVDGCCGMGCWTSGRDSGTLMARVGVGVVPDGSDPTGGGADALAISASKVAALSM